MWVTRKPYCAPGVGVHERTRVLAPGWSSQIAAWLPALCLWPFLGSHFSCVPQPSSAGCMPSDRKPSTDQVLTNTFIGFGALARWVSRSAMWMPLTRARLASRAQSACVFGSLYLRPMSSAMLTSACLTNHDTMPGLAPQHDTAVVLPGFRLRLAAMVISRKA